MKCNILCKRKNEMSLARIHQTSNANSDDLIDFLTKRGSYSILKDDFIVYKPKGIIPYLESLSFFTNINTFCSLINKAFPKQQPTEHSTKEEIFDVINNIDTICGRKLTRLENEITKLNVVSKELFDKLTEYNEYSEAQAAMHYDSITYSTLLSLICMYTNKLMYKYNFKLDFTENDELYVTSRVYQYIASYSYVEEVQNITELDFTQHRVLFNEFDDNLFSEYERLFEKSDEKVWKAGRLRKIFYKPITKDFNLECNVTITDMYMNKIYIDVKFSIKFKGYN